MHWGARLLGCGIGTLQEQVDGMTDWAFMLAMIWRKPLFLRLCRAAFAIAAATFGPMFDRSKTPGAGN